MTRTRRAGLRILTTLAWAIPVTATVTQARPLAPAAATATGPNVLQAGQKLLYDGEYGAPGSFLKAGEFTLNVSSDFVSLNHVIPLTGKDGATSVETGVWFADDGTGEHQADHDRTALTMRRDGNLALTASNGDTLWTSRTSGSGRYNRLVLSATGNLAVFTHENKLVWSSRSTAVFLTPGRSLASGGQLRDAYNPADQPAQTLTMQRNGNLVRRCNDNVLWQSRTYAPGSRLQMTSNGGLGIFTRNNHLVWHANPTVHTTYAYFTMRGMSIERADNLQTLWYAKNVGYQC